MKSFSEIREAWETKKGIEIKRKANTDVEEVKKYTPPTKAEIKAFAKEEIDEGKKGVVLGFKDQYKSRDGAIDDGQRQMKKLGGSSFSVYKSSNGLWAYKIFEEAEEVDEKAGKYTPPTKAEIEADKKNDNKGKPRPSMSAKSITKKLYGK